MIHPRTESQLDRAELLRLAVLRLDARRPGTVERLNDNRQMNFTGTEQADYVMIGHRCLFLTDIPITNKEPVGAERQGESRVELLETRLESRSSEQGPTLQQDSRATPPTVIGVNAGNDLGDVLPSPSLESFLGRMFDRKELVNEAVEASPPEDAGNVETLGKNCISPLLATGVADGDTGAVAQLIEHWGGIPEVAGSNPCLLPVSPSATNTGASAMRSNL